MNHNRIKLNNNKGFTLIELMVTVVLIALILTTVYGMMSAGNRIFAQGDAKADIQSSLRTSANFISDQIRYASNVKILDAPPASMTTGAIQYIYEKDGVLKYYDGGTVNDVPGLLEGVTVALEMEDNNSQNVRIRLTGALKGQTYEVETAAFLLNIGTGALPEGIGKAIAFTQGVPVNADANARLITGIAIYTDHAGITEVAAGGEVALTADVTPSDASRKTVRWVAEGSAVESIETVSATTGLLKIRSDAEPGLNVNVHAIARDGSGTVSNTIVLSVTDGAIEPGITVDVQSDYGCIFMTGGELQMTAKVTPESASGLGVKWNTNVGSSVATIGESDGMLKTNPFNSSTENIIVKATLATGEYDTKSIQIIKNITGATLQKVSQVNVGSSYKVRIKCTVSPDARLATAVNGVKSVTLNITETKKCTVDSIVNNGDGTFDLIVTPTQSQNAYFYVLAAVNPISGSGMSTNALKVEVN